MRLLKNILIFLSLIVALASCSDDHSIEGFYFSKDKNNFEYPLLVQFEDSKHIDYFSKSILDTTVYTKNGDVFYFNNTSQEPIQRRIIETVSGISVHLSDKDSLIVELTKSQSSNFVFDYLSDSEIQVNLPEGNGKEQVLGREFGFHNPLFFWKDGKDLAVNFDNKTMKLDKTFYKFLSENRDKRERASGSLITLIADKSLKVSDLNQLKTQLKLAYFTRISYLLESSRYEFVNSILHPLRPATEADLVQNDIHFPLPPSPPLPSIEVIKNHGLLVSVSNKESIDFSSFESRVRNQLKKDSETIIICYFASDSDYQDYIFFLETINTVLMELRDEYLLGKYQKKYSTLSDNEREYILEARSKYPKWITEVDSTEFAIYQAHLTEVNPMNN